MEALRGASHCVRTVLTPPVRGQTPLHRAAQFGSHTTVERLLDAGATADAVDICGRGLGSWKSRPGFYKLKISQSELSTLRIHSPGECSPTSKGMTPYQLADRQGRANVLGLFNPVPWHCSWKGVQSIHLGGFYPAVDMIAHDLQELEDLWRVSGSSSIPTNS